MPGMTLDAEFILEIWKLPSSLVFHSAHSSPFESLTCKSSLGNTTASHDLHLLLQAYAMTDIECSGLGEHPPCCTCSSCWWRGGWLRGSWTWKHAGILPRCKTTSCSFTHSVETPLLSPNTSFISNVSTS